MKISITSMSKEYEFEELADMAIEELRAFINTENQLVIEEHALIDKLQSWDYIIAHLDERLPTNLTHLYKLNVAISEGLIEIRGLIETGILKGLRIEKEEEHLLQKLKKDVKHRNWRAVKEEEALEGQGEKKAIRLKKHELKKLHSKISKLAKLMKSSRLKKVLEKDLTSPKQKEEYENIEEYYFTEIYKFLRAYEEIFRHLWEKELVLIKKLKI